MPLSKTSRSLAFLASANDCETALFELSSHGAHGRIANTLELSRHWRINVSALSTPRRSAA